MTTAENNTSETGLKRKRDSSPHVETQTEIGNESQLFTIPTGDWEPSCGICYGVLKTPFSVIPCFHTFDQQCLIDYWRRPGNDICPHCKVKATSSCRFNPEVIVKCYNVKQPARKRARVIDLTDLRRERVADNAPANHNGEEVEGNTFHYAEDEVEEYESYEDEDVQVEEDDEDYDDSMVGGRLVFPCPACRPGHPSGYTCPIPIPEPTDAMKTWEAHEHMKDRRSIVEPERGQARVALALGSHNLSPAAHIFTNAVKDGINRACAGHIECANCSAYLPLNRPRRIESTCEMCSRVTCALFDPLGCPFYRALLLVPFYEAGKSINPIVLWEIISRTNRPFMTNEIESTRFHNRLDAHDITPATIVQELIRSAGYGARQYFCTMCIRSLLEREFATWWQRKKASGRIPASAEVARLNNCWYGRECRTQGYNRHADRFNHDCDSRSTGPLEPVPPAPPALVYPSSDNEDTHENKETHENEDAYCDEDNYYDYDEDN